MSRASEDLAVYVDNKESVRRAIQDAGEQLSATELVAGGRTPAQQAQALRQSRGHRAFLDRLRGWWEERTRRWSVGRGKENARASGMSATLELGRG